MTERETAPMKLLVMGAGGVGGFFGGKLARSGTHVTFVARGAHLEAIRERGLTIRTATEGEFTVRTRAVERPDGVGPVDAVLVCVKSFDTEAAAECLRPVVGPETAVLSLQNGVDNEAKLDAILGPGHAVGGVAYVFAAIGGPGLIVHTHGGKIALGEIDGRPTARVTRLAAAFTRAGIPADVTPDIQRVLWEKYLYIAAQAGMTALTRSPTGVIRSIPETWTMYRLIVEELAAVAAREKVGLAPDVVDTIMRSAARLSPDTTSSMYHDVTHGRRLELEALHGHAVRLGARHGVPTPNLFAVYAALKPHAHPA
jgi:2-dehydropantoate 2-reductase